MRKRIPSAVEYIASAALLLVACPEGTGEGRAANPPRDDVTSALELRDEVVQAMDATGLNQTEGACRAPERARVERVIDGDTIHVALLAGSEQRIRLIGVDTPELDHRRGRHDCFAEEARRFTERLTGRTVWLTFDRECQDRYERHLAYVHVGPDSLDLWQRQLVRRGLARSLRIPPNGYHYRRLRQDERRARSERTGLWGSCAVSGSRPFETSRK